MKLDNYYPYFSRFKIFNTINPVSTLFGNALGYAFINKKKSIAITDAPNIIFNKYINEYPAIKDIIKTVEKRITAVDKFEENNLQKLNLQATKDERMYFYKLIFHNLF